MPPGVRCCKRHLDRGNLFRDTHLIDITATHKEAIVTPGDVANLLQELRATIAKYKAPLNFDVDSRLNNKDYYNLTGKFFCHTQILHFHRVCT